MIPFIGNYLRLLSSKVEPDTKLNRQSLNRNSWNNRAWTCETSQGLCMQKRTACARENISFPLAEQLPASRRAAKCRGYED